MLFDEFIFIYVNFWYVVWVRIFGFSLDCGLIG